MSNFLHTFFDNIFLSHSHPSHRSHAKCITSFPERKATSVAPAPVAVDPPDPPGAQPDPDQGGAPDGGAIFVSVKTGPDGKPVKAAVLDPLEERRMVAEERRAQEREMRKERRLGGRNRPASAGEWAASRKTARQAAEVPKTSDQQKLQQHLQKRKLQEVQQLDPTTSYATGKLPVVDLTDPNDPNMRQLRRRTCELKGMDVFDDNGGCPPLKKEWPKVPGWVREAVEDNLKLDGDVGFF